jgi:hypothetical protein
MRRVSTQRQTTDITVTAPTYILERTMGADSDPSTAAASTTGARIFFRSDLIENLLRYLFMDAWTGGGRCRGGWAGGR